jgi:hypothetical protein
LRVDFSLEVERLRSGEQLVRLERLALTPRGRAKRFAKRWIDRILLSALHLSASEVRFVLRPGDVRVELDCHGHVEQLTPLTREFRGLPAGCEVAEVVAAIRDHLRWAADLDPTEAVAHGRLAFDVGPDSPVEMEVRVERHPRHETVHILPEGVGRW